MSDQASPLVMAARLIASGDPELFGILGLSLRVSLTASFIAFLIGAPMGAMLCMRAFPGKGVVILSINALLGLPPVVVGLVLYLLLSRAGLLGSMGMLFTPSSMILAQICLALPIVAALTHRVCVDLWQDYGAMLTLDGANSWESMATLFSIGRASLVTVFLAAFGRAIAEVGATLVVGGNIRGITRTMTTAITLETSRGNLALALSLGLILIALTFLVSLAAHQTGQFAQRR